MKRGRVTSSAAGPVHAEVQGLKAHRHNPQRNGRGTRTGAGLSLMLWIGVIATGRMIAYDWFDCNKDLSRVMYWAAGCVNELAALEVEG